MPGPQIRRVDQNVTFMDQLDSDAGPVVLVNTFYVEPAAVDAALECYARDAAFMKAQPGFISVQLHRGIGGSSVFVNYAVWESAAALKAASGNPQFRKLVEQFPQGMSAAPVLVKKIALPNVCRDSHDKN